MLSKRLAAADTTRCVACGVCENACPLGGCQGAPHCGNIIAKVKDTGVPVICCGEPMSEIVPGTTDAAVEKHVPVWTVENGIVHVKVGSLEHPMLPEHYIEWVSLQTKQGNQRKELHPGEKPEVCFALCEGDEVEAVYAYCNLHSLWKA